MKRMFTCFWALGLCLVFSQFAFAQPKEAMPRPDGKTGNFRLPPRKFGDWGRGEDIIIAMGKLKKENPEEFKRLDEMRKTDIEGFIREIKKYLPAPKNNHKKIFSLDAECRELARKIKESKDDAEKAVITATLKAKIKESFDIMISDATQRLEKLRKNIESLKENEEYVLSERLDALLNPVKFHSGKKPAEDDKNALLPPPPPPKPEDE